MRLAAIDMGTNSLHMIVVQVRPDFSFEVVDREKEMVRLGAGGLDGRSLTPEAMHTALQVLAKFKRIADSHGVEEIVATATSAVREADNGSEFLRVIRHETGIHARAISGTEEARLIHLAAGYGVGSTDEVLCVIDIGGGSVEITRGRGGSLEQGRSFKVGVIRLTERFVKSDPIAPRDERKLVRHVEHELGDYLDRLVAKGWGRVVGTSGTALSLGAIALAEDGRAADASVRNQRVSIKGMHRVRKRLVQATLEERLRVPGLEPRRADIAVAGAILLDTILRRLGASEITLCDLSLREGLMLDYIARHRQRITQADRYPDVRRRSVIELAERCNYAVDHSAQIARLCGWLFDATRGIHGLTDREREWLEYASLLHDIGVHISYEGHHKHSCYLIQHGDLRGFEPNEVDIIALIARYHRRATPKKTHDGFCDLTRPQQRTVRTLAAILRLAEGLDRSHAQSVAGLTLVDDGEEAVLLIKGAGDVELEVWAAARQAEPFQRMIGKPIRVDVSKDAHAEHADHAARVPGQVVRRRGHRRLRQNDAAGAAGEVAGRRRAPGVRHRVELVRPREGSDEGRQKEEHADAHDVQPAPRHRLR
jgi:exopolyphosphatase/guanosine-5'-triphosphate,3'-diphosphate pyrophosphatase